VFLIPLPFFQLTFFVEGAKCLAGLGKFPQQWAYPPPRSQFTSTDFKSITVFVFRQYRSGMSLQEKCGSSTSIPV